jgi:hypothetical protein
MTAPNELLHTAGPGYSENGWYRSPASLGGPIPEKLRQSVDLIGREIRQKVVREADGPSPVGLAEELQGTHVLGLVEADEAADAEPSGDWRRHVSTTPEYTVPTERAEELAEKYGRELVAGPAGAVFAFHPSIVHSSSENLSPDRRALLLITCSAVGNAPGFTRRPEFLVSRDTTPVVPVENDVLSVIGG